MVLPPPPHKMPLLQVLDVGSSGLIQTPKVIGNNEDERGGVMTEDCDYAGLTIRNTLLIIKINKGILKLSFVFYPFNGLTE